MGMIEVNLVLNKKQLLSLLLSLGVLCCNVSLAQTTQTTQNENSGTKATESKAQNAAGNKAIYKIVNSDGTVTYTDKPASQAQPMAFDDKTLNVVNAAKAPVLPPPVPTKAKPQYRVSIVSPQPEATVRNNLGEVTISAKQLGTPKAPLFRLVFDGAPYKSNSSGLFKLKGIHRGAHTFKIELTNNTGKTLASSPTQTLYLHQASALINN
jgi:hypothetical protein